jgi:hypothetical protein
MPEILFQSPRDDTAAGFQMSLHPHSDRPVVLDSVLHPGTDTAVKSAPISQSEATTELA